MQKWRCGVSKDLMFSGSQVMILYKADIIRVQCRILITKSLERVGYSPRMIKILFDIGGELRSLALKLDYAVIKELLSLVYPKVHL